MLTSETRQQLLQHINEVVAVIKNGMEQCQEKNWSQRRLVQKLNLG
jgi:hypothetical protein